MARVNDIFTSKNRHLLDKTMDTHYWYNLPHNNYLKRHTPLNPSSLSYTQIRTKNSNFNPAFYAKPMNTILRTDLDEDWDVKQDCHNKYPSMSYAEMMNNVPLVSVGRNGSRLTDPKSISQGVASTDRTLNYMTPNNYLAIKQGMRQPSGMVY